MGIIIILSLGAGAAITAALADDGKCGPGGCSVVRSPLAGIVIGAVLLGLVAFAWLRPGHRGDSLAHIPTIATTQQFDANVLKSPTPVLVDFFATWCQPCRDLEPTIASLEADYRGRVAFFRVDVDAAPDVAKAMRIEALPTIIIFRDGRPVVPPLVGGRPEATYRQALDQALKAPGT